MSPAIALAVTAIIRTGSAPLRASSLRISSAAWNPSRTGIWQSISTASNGSDLNRSTTSLPFAATTDSTPIASSMPTATAWFTALSSATSTRPLSGLRAEGPLSRSPWTCVNVLSMPVISPVRSALSRNVNEKLEPLPGLLVSVIAPPIISTSCLLIARPSPVPPYRRVVEPSSWANDSKTCCCLRGEIPIPVSITSNVTCSNSPWSGTDVTFSSTRPFSVNLMALPRRLVSTCLSRAGSPSTLIEAPSGTMWLSRNPFWSARPARLSVISATNEFRLNGLVSRASLPASIFEKSRISLMMSRSVSAE